MMCVFAFLMSYSNILIFGLNVSLFLFAYFYILYFQSINLLKIGTIPNILAVLIGIAAIVSVSDVNAKASDGFARGMAVLPNYLYWCVLIIMFTNIRYYINYGALAKYVFWGVIATYLSLNFPLPIVKPITPNGYAFVMVCFAPISILYVAKKYNKVYAIILLAVLIVALVLEERRAGMTLVTLGSLAAVFIQKIRFSNLLLPLTLGILTLGLIQLESVENTFYNASPRIHEFIYQNDDLLETDFSYLTRRAQVEKGLIIFEQHPVTGIGLNNFINYRVDFRGDFEGSELVVDRSTMDEKSAHNSYINLLAEGGLLILIPFLLLLLYNLLNFFMYYNRRNPYENAFYWGFFAMCIHIYFITEIVNVFAWYLIAIVSSLSLLYQDKTRLIALKIDESEKNNPIND